jgi:hypothetical protein
MIPLWKGKNLIYVGVIRSKVKVTITINKKIDNRIVSARTPVYINYQTIPYNDPKINRVLPLPEGNHVAKFGKDPIYINSL